VNPLPSAALRFCFRGGGLVAGLHVLKERLGGGRYVMPVPQQDVRTPERRLGQGDHQAYQEVLEAGHNPDAEPAKRRRREIAG
jgi:hypothetical protein